jgi:hypothetical protein
MRKAIQLGIVVFVAIVFLLIFFLTCFKWNTGEEKDKVIGTVYDKPETYGKWNGSDTTKTGRKGSYTIRYDGALVKVDE